jgi:hypothetical protein
MFREIIRATPLAAGLGWAFWYHGIPLAWATVLAALTTPTIWIVPLLKKEISRR